MEEEVDITEEADLLQKTHIVIDTKNTERGIEVTAAKEEEAEHPNLRKNVNIVLETVMKRGRKDINVVTLLTHDDGNGITIMKIIEVNEKS